jgi:four helix bundle protein
LTDADAEQLETQHWIELSLDCKYITNETAAELSAKCKTIGKMLHGIISKADQFSR